MTSTPSNLKTFPANSPAGRYAFKRTCLTRLADCGFYLAPDGTAVAMKADVRIDHVGDHVWHVHVYLPDQGAIDFHVSSNDILACTDAEVVEHEPADVALARTPWA